MRVAIGNGSNEDMGERAGDVLHDRHQPAHLEILSPPREVAFTGLYYIGCTEIRIFLSLLIL